MVDQAARLDPTGYEIEQDGVALRGSWTGEEAVRPFHGMLTLQIGPGWLELIPMAPERLEAAVAEVGGWIAAARG